MNIDPKNVVEDGSQSREHRSRTNLQQVIANAVGTPTERTAAGGPTPSSQTEHRRTRDATDEESRGRQSRAGEQRREAEDELAKMLRLPTDTRLDIKVDYAKDQIRFQIRDRETGELVREIPPDEAKPLIEKLREFSGALVDRSF